MDTRASGGGENITNKNYAKDCGHENCGIIMEEVQAAVASLKNFSAPNPEEKVLNIMLKRGGVAVVKGLHYIFQKCWSKAVLLKVFITDAKVMLPKSYMWSFLGLK